MELWMYIISHSQNSTATLKTWSLVCRSFKSETHRFLFHSIYIDSQDTTYPSGTSTKEQFLHYLSQPMNHISPHIRTFDVMILDNDYEIIDFGTKIMEALRTMRNLKDLRAIGPGRSQEFGLRHLAQNPPFQLRSLDTDITSDDGLAEFVHSQPTLIRVCWSNIYETEGEVPTLDVTQLPRLKMLGLRFATILLLQFPITHLMIWTLDGILPCGVLRSVRALTVQTSLTSMNREVLIGNFPNVEFLDICEIDIVSVSRLWIPRAQTGCLIQSSIVQLAYPRRVW